MTLGLLDIEWVLVQTQTKNLIVTYSYTSWMNLTNVFNIYFSRMRRGIPDSQGPKRILHTRYPLRIRP